MSRSVFRRLPVEQAVGDHYGGRHRLRAVYRTPDLVVLGLGVMIGAGIFSIAARQAAGTAGPAVVVSFLIAGGVCLLAALAYAEMGALVPVAGSAYAFTYVAFGEIWGWLVGWSLVLELLLAASAVSRAWSLYAAQTLAGFDVPVPGWLGGLIGQRTGFDVFALAILALLVLLVAIGGRVGLRTLWLIVVAKLAVLGLVVGVGATYFDAGNLRPFVPPARPAPSGGTMLESAVSALTGGGPQVFGVWGVLAAAPAIVFAYIGFDLVATAAEETGDAPRRVPRGILGALVAAIVGYTAVALVLTAMVRYDRIDPEAATLSGAFDAVGAGGMGRVIDIGAVLGLTTVILVVLVALTRVVFSLGRDGLLPASLGRTGRYRVPTRATLVAGGAAIVMTQTVDVLALEPLVVMGALFTFLFVAAAVPALRRSRPDLPRPFRVRAPRTVATATIVLVVWLLSNLPFSTLGWFACWMAAGLAVYLLYGRRHSHLRQTDPPPPPASRTPTQNPGPFTPPPPARDARPFTPPPRGGPPTHDPLSPARNAGPLAPPPQGGPPSHGPASPSRDAGPFASPPEGGSPSHGSASPGRDAGRFAPPPPGGPPSHGSASPAQNAGPLAPSPQGGAPTHDPASPSRDAGPLAPPQQGGPPTHDSPPPARDAGPLAPPPQGGSPSHGSASPSRDGGPSPRGGRSSDPFAVPPMDVPRRGRYRRDAPQ